MKNNLAKVSVKVSMMGLSAIFSSSVLAASNKNAPPALGVAVELLKLPAENRRSALKGQNQAHYNNFISVAFDNVQPMTLRWRALIAAADSKGVDSTSDILKASNSEQWFMRNASLVAMAKANPSEASKLAHKLLKDKALVVRSAAVETLVKDSSSETRELLWAELDQAYNFKGKQSLWIRPQIVELLASKPQDSEFRTFAKLLNDKDPRVHVAAIQGVEKITGVKLGEGEMKVSQVVGLWKEYLKDEKILF